MGVLSPALILSGWCQCLYDRGCSFRRLKDVSPALLSARLLEPSVWRLSFPCHAQSFSVNPFIHLLVLPASRQLCWEHGKRPDAERQRAAAASEILMFRAQILPIPRFTAFSSRERNDREWERWKWEMKQRQEDFSFFYAREEGRNELQL